MRLLPKFLKKYFWDVDFQTLDKKVHPRFIIERILEYGDPESVNWIKRNFKTEQIKSVISDSNNFSKRTANFLSIYFNVKKDKVLCLKKSFQQKRRLTWEY